MNEKLLGFDVLKGSVILSVGSHAQGDKTWIIHTNNGTYELWIDDDGCGGCNDSYAFLESVDGIENIIGKTITNVDDKSNSYSATIKLMSDEAYCTIKIIHEQNGYYGFSYQLIKLT